MLFAGVYVESFSVLSSLSMFCNHLVKEHNCILIVLILWYLAVMWKFYIMRVCLTVSMVGLWSVVVAFPHLFM